MAGKMLVVLWALCDRGEFWTGRVDRVLGDPGLENGPGLTHGELQQLPRAAMRGAV